MLLANALEALYARAAAGMRLGLDAMNLACAAAGHPERAFATVHIAGTNGKGSTCAMVEAIARANGWKTGLYTSPHLCRFAERIRIDGAPIDDERLAELLTQTIAIAPDLSFFETATLAAFLAFRDAKVDIAVLEVGIGGRLDATNVIPPPRAAAITRIALDHMDKLGDTLTQIAREKAAIAKPGVTLVVGETDVEVRGAIDDVAHAHGAITIDAAGDDARAFLRATPPRPLAGEHQRRNELVAYRIARVLGIDESAIARGLNRARWPGRLERVDAREGAYLLDGAHNPDGAKALADHLRAGEKSEDGVPSPLALVFGALADKAWPEMIDQLAEVIPHRVYVEPKGRAAVPATDLAARQIGDVAATLSEALEVARRKVGPKGLVVVAGSLYLVGEARALLLALPCDPPVAL